MAGFGRSPRVRHCDPTPTGGRIVVGGHRGGTSLFVVELLTSNGEVVGEYYHPGWLWAMGIMDLDADGSDEIILGGVNNAYDNVPGFDRPMTLVVLDSRRVQGQGRAPLTDDRNFWGLSMGHERAVLLFPSFGHLPADDPSDFSIFREVGTGEGHFEVAAVKLSNRDMGADYQFDSHLNLEMVVPKPQLAELLDAKLGPHPNQIERVRSYVNLLGDIKVLKNDYAAPPRISQ